MRGCAQSKDEGEPLVALAPDGLGSNSNSGGGDKSTTTLLKIDTNNYHYVDRESMY